MLSILCDKRYQTELKYLHSLIEIFSLGHFSRVSGDIFSFVFGGFGGISVRDWWELGGGSKEAGSESSDELTLMKREVRGKQ